MKQVNNKYFSARIQQALIWVFVLCFLVPFASAEQVDKILIVSDQSHEYHQLLVKSLSSELQDLNIDPTSVGDESLSTTVKNNYKLIITVGFQAANLYINKNINVPVLSLLVPQKVHTNLLNQQLEIDKQRLFSAIYIDQPIDRQLRLIKHLSNNFRTVGILLGQHSYNRKNELQSAVQQQKLNSYTITVHEPSQLITETRNVAKNADVLLAIPDNTIYNRRSIKGILLTTYRHQIPVIGFSSAYVKAGALAAVYSTHEDISVQAKSIIKNILQQPDLTVREFPKYFNIAINNKVSHSLNLKTYSQKDLLEKLYQEEKE